MTRQDLGKLLTISEAAALLNTSERFPRRLIEERRIVFVKLGRHVRIPERELDAFIVASIVPRITINGYERGRAA